MLPTLPTGAVPPATQDVARISPQPAVAPVQPAASDSSVGLDQQRPGESADRLREEQRRRRRRGYTPEQLATGATEAEDREALAELPRQGLWIDTEA